MAFKSLTFTLEITVGTLNENLQGKEMIDEFEKALTEGIDQFTAEIAKGSDGHFTGVAKLVSKPEDWQ
jgi:hypothetical protein